jgi:hypothetical protein
MPSRELTFLQGSVTQNDQQPAARRSHINLGVMGSVVEPRETL